MDKVMWYRECAQNFNEAIPLGNGSIGAMVYGSLPVERISLNLDTLWSGKPNHYLREGAYEAYAGAKRKIADGDYAGAERLIEEEFTGPNTAAYLPMGTLSVEISCAGYHENYERRLDLFSGIASVRSGGLKTEYFVSNRFRCLVTSVEMPEKRTVTYTFSSELKTRYQSSRERFSCFGECPSSFEGDTPIYDGEGIRFFVNFRILTDGIIRYSADGATVRDASHAVLFLSAESSFIDEKNISDTSYPVRAQRNVDSALKAGATSVKKEHIDYYSGLMNRVTLDLPKKETNEDIPTRLKDSQNDFGLIELLFQYGRYLTIAASAPGTQATNLQGIWNEDLRPIWRSNYTVNINTEMNYWPTLICNLPEFSEPLVGLARKISRTGEITAKHDYHAKGFVCHHNVDLWGNTTAVGGLGEEYIPHNSNFSFWNGAGGWFGRNLFDVYEYTEDQEYLRDVAFPLMKKAAFFYLDVLEDTGERMVISPATSPENQYVLDDSIHSMGRWTCMTQSIVLDLFQNCVKCCDILGVDAGLKALLQGIIPKLKPFEVDEDGKLREWDRDVLERDPGHRHVSHLYGLYPGELLSTETTPELANACKNVLLARGDEGTGWSLAWKACLWAKLKDGDHALKLIRRQLQLVDSDHFSCELWGGGTYPNLLCAHPPFQIDGNYGISAAIAMLFMQCEDGVIRLLPALPSEMQQGSIRGLLAKGNVIVSLDWLDHKLKTVELYSEKEKDVTISYGVKTDTVKLPGKQSVRIVL